MSIVTKPRGRWLAIVAGLVVALVLVLFFALRPGDELDALRADPLARWAPRIEPTSVDADEEGSPDVELYGPLPVFGDREGATYIRMFLVARADALKPFEAARRAASAAGWRMDYPDYTTADSPPGKTLTTVVGWKELSTGAARVAITLDTAPANVPGAGPAKLRGKNSLTIMLEHTR